MKGTTREPYSSIEIANQNFDNNIISFQRKHSVIYPILILICEDKDTRK
jgi:hypothetical protein